MASASVTVVEEDELKGDGKKRKFKPLEGLRKLFGKGKRKGKEEAVSVVAVKAKSTTALHDGPDDDDDDDDGGFKDRQPRPLRGNLSISEDSIFSPDVQQREPNLQALKAAAVSAESLPKSAFQAELFNKLTKRRSQYSDEDDGLPHSPTPPVTTADIIMGGPLKPLPGKSTSRESDNSLISNDASDNEEDDPFKTKWKSSVPSKLSRKPADSGGGAEAPVDFENLGQTELLKSDIAKDRISIKPRSRKTNRQSRKKREGQSPHSLPSLNEESPPKSRTDRASTSSISSISEVTDTKPPPSPSGIEKPRIQTPPPAHTSHHSALTRTTSAEPSPSTRRPVSASITTISTGTERKEGEDKRASLKAEPKSPSWKEEAGFKSFPSPKGEKPKENISAKIEVQSSSSDEKRSGFKVEPRSPTIKTSVDFIKSSDPKSPTLKSADPKSPTIKTSMDLVKAQMESESRTKVLSSSRTMESLKKDDSSTDSLSKDQGAGAMSKSMILIGSSSSSSSSKTSAVSESSGATPKVELTSSTSKPNTEVASSQIQPEPKSSQTTVLKPGSTTAQSATVVTKPSASPGESRKEGLRPTDTQASPAFSPKDDYKLKRQSRSKTLPDQPTGLKEEPFAARVQRAASHRAEPSTSQNASPDASPRHHWQKGGATDTAPASSSSSSSSSSKTKEPEWFALARRKTGRQESEEKEKEKDSPPTEVKDTATTPTPAASGGVASKEEAASKGVETSSNVSVSAASAKFGDSTKPSEVSRFRGGSVKTSPAKTSSSSSVFGTRGSSVKVQSAAKAEASSSGTVSLASSKTNTVSSSSSFSSSSANKQEDMKEESKVSESPFKEVPKWKTQSVKTPSAFSSSCSSSSSSTTAASAASTSSSTSSSLVSSRFSGIKSSSQTAPAPMSAVTKTESKTTSSPAKSAPLTKAPSEEDKDKPGVPAWRANLGQKKTAGGSDIKIELIETSTASSKPASKPISSSTSSSSSSASTAAGASREDSAKKEEKKEESKQVSGSGKDVGGGGGDQCRSSAAPTKKSKVMNLLKNFENVQGVS